MSPVAKDNKDEDGMKLDKRGATFSSFNAFGGKCVWKFYNVVLLPDLKTVSAIKYLVF